MKKRVAEIFKPFLGEEPPVNLPKNREFGHYAIPVFKYAKAQKRNPAEFARELGEKVVQREEFEKVEPVGGFLNLTLSQKFLDQFANRVLEEGEEFGKGSAPVKESILLEYISANPTGPLHIGHGRGAVFGDALLRIGRHLGHKIVAEYYVNDAGRQIYLLGLSLWLAGREELGLPVEYPEEYYRGEYIKELAKGGLKELGEEPFRNESGVEQLAEWGKDKMLEEIKRDLEAMGITPFDNWVSEKEIFTRWEEVRQLLEKAGALYEKDGKVWLKSTQFGDDKDRVVIREDGRPTYLAGDIVYHWDKFRRGFDRYINIWGADHHGYIARVKSAIKFLGYDPAKLEILLAQMVKLLKGGEPFKMSKRAGNFILVRDLVEEVGADPMRFIFLTKKPDTHLEFDIDQLSQQDSSNPAFYINYAHARIRSIFRKIGKEYRDFIPVELNSLGEEEKALLFSAFQLPYILEEAFTHREPHRLTNYLYRLASDFHSYYNRTRILETPEEAERLKVVAVIATILKLGLGLLGVTAKERM
ncbi:MAG: arginine--tRNA ligase [Epsilonproteobacteria bacterium]|nr:arginine--tRNA ligase [Campylobacterota bacterium]NPA89442.1 arginine--tRNA ligase [Campylobacterota bacterium]